MNLFKAFDQAVDRAVGHPAANKVAAGAAVVFLGGALIAGVVQHFRGKPPENTNTSASAQITPPAP